MVLLHSHSQYRALPSLLSPISIGNEGLITKKMKCKECGEPMTVVSYWHGLAVHPTCFDILQWKENHLTLKERREKMLKRWKKRK